MSSRKGRAPATDGRNPTSPHTNDAPEPATRSNQGDDADLGYTLWALADDWMAEHAGDVGIEPDDVYDWLVARGREWGAR